MRMAILNIQYAVTILLELLCVLLISEMLTSSFSKHMSAMWMILSPSLSEYGGGGL